MTPSWAAALLRDRLRRAAETEAQVGSAFPLYRAQGEGWTTTRRGSWAGGFWAALLALRAAITGRGDPGAARAGLDQWLDEPTVCRGMIFWYGSCGERAGVLAPSVTTALAAERLAASFDDSLSAIPWGTALAPAGPAIRPDGAAGVIPLLLDHGHAPIAVRHLGAHLRGDPPRWQRGTAWLLLACADAHLHGVARAAELRGLSASFDPAGPDAGASTIAAVALLKSGIGDLRRDGERLLRRAAEGTPEYGGRLHAQTVWAEFFVALGAALVLEEVDPSAW